MAEEPKNRRRTGRTPWLKIARAVPLSFDARKVVLGAVALILIQAGSLVLDRIAPGAFWGEPSLLDVEERPGAAVIPGAPRFNLAVGQVAEPVHVFTGPLLRLLPFNRGIAETTRAALELLWAVVVMGIFGGAISRGAVAELARGDRTTLGKSLGSPGGRPDR